MVMRGQRPFLHPAKNIGPTATEFLGGRNIGIEPAADQRQRLRRQQADIQRRNRPRGLAKRHHRPARAQNPQPFEESRRADAVINGVNTFAAGEAHHLGRKIAVDIIDGFVNTGLAARSRLGRGGHGTQDARAAIFRQPGDHPTDAAGGRMHQDGIAGLYRIGAGHQVMGAEAISDETGGKTQIKAFRYRHDPAGRHGNKLGERSACPAKTYRLADRDIVDVGADSHDITAGLAAQRRRHVFRLCIQKGIGVDIVDPCRLDPDQRVARSEYRIGDLHVDQAFRPHLQCPHVPLPSPGDTPRDHAPLFPNSVIVP